MKTVAEDLKSMIRDIPDFPKKGIIFKDITPLLKDKRALKSIVDTLSGRYKGKKIDLVVCVEARGFILGSAIAYKLGAGMIPVRKKGKLPYRTKSITYDLEYGTDTLEMHEDALEKGTNVLVIDDLLATGGTAAATCDMVTKAGGTIVEGGRRGVGRVAEAGQRVGRAMSDATDSVLDTGRATGKVIVEGTQKASGAISGAGRKAGRTISGTADSVMDTGRATGKVIAKGTQKASGAISDAGRATKAAVAAKAAQTAALFRRKKRPPAAPAAPDRKENGNA